MYHKAEYEILDQLVVDNFDVNDLRHNLNLVTIASHLLMTTTLAKAGQESLVQKIKYFELEVY